MEPVFSDMDELKTWLIRWGIVTVVIPIVTTAVAAMVAWLKAKKRLIEHMTVDMTEALDSVYLTDGEGKHVDLSGASKLKLTSRATPFLEHEVHRLRQASKGRPS